MAESEATDQGIILNVGTTFSVMVLGIERHLLLHLQLEMNKKIFFTYTSI